MNISVDLNSLENIHNSLNTMESNIKKIEHSFRYIVNALDSDITKEPDIHLLIKDIILELESISYDILKFSKFLEHTIGNYESIERRIADMSYRISQVYQIELVSKIIRKSQDNYLTNIKKTKSHDILSNGTIKKSTLPKREDFFNSDIKPGTIANGKNILVRSWIK